MKQRLGAALAARKASVLRFLRQPPMAFKAFSLIVASAMYGSAGYLYFERPDKPGLTWLDSLWWSVVTMTTVGYGDFFPTTQAGRFLVAYPVMLVGMAFVAFSLTTFAGFFIRAEALNRRGIIMGRPKNHTVICSFSANGTFARLMEALRASHTEHKGEVVLVDPDLEELEPHWVAMGVRFVRGDPAKQEALHRAGIQDAARAIVLAKRVGSPDCDHSTAAVCLTIAQLAPNVHTVAECLDPESRALLERAGCRSVVCVGDLAPGILAHEAGERGIARVLRELAVWGDALNNLFLVPYLGQKTATVGQLRACLRAQNATLLGLRLGDTVKLNPVDSEPVALGSAVVVMAQDRPNLNGFG